ncbi:MAG TPA: hypothetical protein VHB73_03350 [Alphaproteobacteria bacterium]|nr:hypothetical protein [Alphaproteobacteria bacterium]
MDEKEIEKDRDVAARRAFRRMAEKYRAEDFAGQYVKFAALGLHTPLYGEIATGALFFLGTGQDYPRVPVVAADASYYAGEILNAAMRLVWRGDAYADFDENHLQDRALYLRECGFETMTFANVWAFVVDRAGPIPCDAGKRIRAVFEGVDLPKARAAAVPIPG